MGERTAWKERWERALGVRYVKLHFTVSLLSDAILPVHKVSALRGGMGEMLLRLHCIRDRNCESCDFEEECPVRRMMYARFEIRPDFVTQGESIGYILECEDYREALREGETLSFNLLLFGKSIVYLNHFIQAFCMLGMEGIGKRQARFQVVSITNTRGEAILRDGTIYMEKCEVTTLLDYVEYRMGQIACSGRAGILVFKTPLTLKYRGAFLKEFRMDAIVEACVRRIYMLDCYEGIREDVTAQMPAIPEMITQEAHSVRVRRFSSRQQSGMILQGIEGRLVAGGFGEELLPILLSGELVHIGKNSRFGFGRFQVKQEREHG